MIWQQFVLLAWLLLTTAASAHKETDSGVRVSTIVLAGALAAVVLSI